MSTHHAVLYPAIAEAARRVGAAEVGLIDVKQRDASNLFVDRVGITYSNGHTLGDMVSPVQETASIIGKQPVPDTALPLVVARIAVDANNLDHAITLSDNVSDAINHVPDGVLPVVMTTWALSRYSRTKRLQLVQSMTEAGRTVAWVSAEGVGVGPGVPTLGDRPASGHSIIAIGLVDDGIMRVDAVGRCWSRGRMLSWFEP